jgi:hypothetical protein
LVATVALPVMLVLASATAAQAHDASGLMSIDAATVGVSTPGGAPGELTVTVRITYANDGDPAPGAVATASATESGGAVAAPVTLADAGDGSYTGALLLPSHGTWVVHVESTNPAASAEQTVEVTPASSTTSTTEVGSTTSSTLARMKESTSSTSSDDDSTTIVLIAIAAVIVAAGLTTWLILRSRAKNRT